MKPILFALAITAFAQLGRADLLMFFDPDASFLFPDQSRMSICSLSLGDTCVSLFGPGAVRNPMGPTTGPTLVSTTIPSELVVNAGDGTVGNILTTFSNFIPGPYEIDIHFITEQASGSGSLGLCSDFAFVGGCAMTADGTVLTAGTVTWSDGTVDTVKFTADFDPVPEPSAWLLLVTVMIAFGTMERVFSSACRSCQDNSRNQS